IGKTSEEKIGDDQHKTSSSRATLDGTKLSLERASSSVTKDPDLGGKVTESADKKTGLTIANGKGELARSSKQETVVDGQKFGKERSTSIGTDGTFKTSSATTKVVKDDAGEHSQTKGTSFSANKDGGSLAYQRENKNADGSSSKASLTAGIDAKKG